ncbi:MAG: homing endonuclease associated repeat-containing protein [Armatimonadota bacterium]
MFSGEVVTARCRHSDEMLLEEVCRVAALVDGPTLTSTEFHRHSSVGINTLKARFGNWHDVLESAEKICLSPQTSI